MTVSVRLLGAEEARSLRPALAEILADCVAGGASISFMSPFTPEAAAEWWGSVIDAVGAGRIALLGAFDDGHLVGSAQLGLEFPENQRHRAEVKKVIVHRRARGRGVATALMAALDAEARRRGRTLLTLDTATGSDAERLYERLGWSRVGIIPNQALWPDGRPCDATLFWKTP
jgi:GNAT superfamily N-acetyltransferase